MKNKYYITVQFLPDKNLWELDLKVNTNESFSWLDESFELVVLDFIRSVMQEKLQGYDLINDMEMRDHETTTTNNR